MFQNAQVVLGLHVVRAGCGAPFGHDLGAGQKPLRLLVLSRGNDQRRDAFLARASGPTRPVQQGFRVRRQVSVDHQLQPRQVDAPRGDVGGDTDPRPSVPQRLQRMGPFLLRKLARQRHNLEPPVAHAGKKVVHVHARLAEDDGRARIVVPQHVENRMLAVTDCHAKGVILDVDVLLRLALRLDAQRVLLERPGQLFDFLRHGGREHQRAAFRRGGGENELQVFGKAQVQHLVRFVQHGGLQTRKVQAAAFDVVAQPARSADDNMCAAFKRALFGPVVHAANAGRDLGTGPGVEPFQLTRDLQRQFPGRCNDQRQRVVGIKQRVLPVQHFGCDCQAKGHRLARTGLRRDQQVAPGNTFGQDSVLYRGQRFIALEGQSLRQRRGHVFNRHDVFPKGGEAMRPSKPNGLCPLGAGLLAHSPGISTVRGQYPKPVPLYRPLRHNQPRHRFGVQLRWQGQDTLGQSRRRIETQRRTISVRHHSACLFSDQ